MTAERVANTPDMVARFVAVFDQTPMRDLIANLDSTVDQITVAGRAYPVTLNQRDQRGNCYICNPVTAYIDYAIDETRHFKSHPALRLAIRTLIGACAPLLRAAGIDHQVQINNWLFSTNPVPTLTQGAVAAMRDNLTAAYPDRALVIRSLNTTADAATLGTLRDAGFRLLPARQIYLFDATACTHPSANMKRDRLALARTDHDLVTNDDITEADYARAAQLYEMLYIDKYTPLNPRYTALYLRRMHIAGLMQLRGLRASDGRLVAVTGLFANGRTLTQPIVGYDTTRPRQEGLYRMVMAMAQDIAMAQGLFFNMSAGAAAFKRHRMAVPVIEYTAVYAQHLGHKKRSALRVIEAVLTKVGIPILQRFGL